MDVGPWDGFEDGDTVRVLVGSDQRIFGTAPASADDKYGIVTVVVPARNFSFLADGTYEVVAQVVNRLGVPVSSPPETLRLKLSVPGGLDPVADTTHRNENLAAPTVEPMLIDKDTATATVTVPAWDNLAQGDRLILRWGLTGNETTFDVTDPAAPVPPFTVDRAMIDQGGSGSKVEVTYHIFDLVGNWSLFAPPTNVDVEAPDALPAPWVAPTVGDAGEVIEVPALAGGDATAEVYGLQLGDLVTVRFLGTTAEGLATEYTPPPQTVTVAGRPLLFVLPNRLFPPLIQGACAVGYTAVRGGVALPPSSLRRLAVTGETAQLAPPSVDEAIGDTLDPAHVPNGAHASVPADPQIAPGTRVTLEMYGTSTGNVPVGHQDYRDIGDSTPFPLRFLIPAGKIALLAGSTATFAYTVDTFTHDGGRPLRRRREGNGTLPSPERTYRILGSSANLPPPSVPEAEDGRLDPAKVDPLIGVRVDVDGVLANDRVTVSWIGTRYPTPYTEALTAHGPRVSFFVPKAPFVDANVDGDVNVEYTVEGKGRSDPLSLHIGAEQAVPAITGVRDSSGNELTNGDATTDTTLTLRGTARPNEQVEIFDGATSKGIAAVDENGEWSLTVTGLAVAGHAFTAKARYGSNPVSTPWAVTVMQLITPDITGVRDAQGDVSNGGSTEDTTLTLSGTAQPNEHVEIFDGAMWKGIAQVNGSGAWSLIVTDLAVAGHAFTAEASYGSNPVSTPWVVTVIQSLTVDPTEMTLNGPRVIIDGWPTKGVDLPGNTKTRQASGGKPPYAYSSSQSSIASVTQDGKVTGLSNGAATISITDADQRTVSYPVKVSRVYRLLMNEGPLTHVSQALTWMAQQGGSPVSNEIMESMFTLYDMSRATKHYWLCTQEGCESYGLYTFFNYEQPTVNCAPPDHPAINAAWCVKPT